MTAEGMGYLAGPLEGLRQLRALDVSANGLGADGASMLAGAAAQMRALASLRAGDNAVGDAGGAGLRAACGERVALDLTDTAAAVDAPVEVIEGL